MTMRRTEPLKDQYDNWTVLDPTDKSPKVLCICKCGTERLVYRHLLRAGQSRSCGCLRGEQLRSGSWDTQLPVRRDQEVVPGAVFGRLVVTGEPEPTEPGKKHRMVPVRCTCPKDKHFKVAIASLRNGNTKSCGCYRRDVSRERASV
jgi:hypothetical protein